MIAEVLVALCLTYAEPKWQPECIEAATTPRETDEDAHIHVVRKPKPTDTTYRGMGSDTERWRPLVAAYFGSETDLALCVVEHESGGNPEAKNPTSTARGLFQILASLWAPHFGVSYSDLYDPELNVMLAKQIRDAQGWNAWSVYKKGLCS